MKKSLIISALTALPALWASTAPDNVANHTIRLDMGQAFIARTPSEQPAAAPWYALGNITDFVIDFGAEEAFDATVSYSEHIRNAVRVSYHVGLSSSPVINLENSDFNILITLDYLDSNSGTAEIRWDEAGNTRHLCNISFTALPDSEPGCGVTLPQEILADTPGMPDDGLNDILHRLNETPARSATDKLYRKRLNALLPLIMQEDDVSYTTPDFKGNTALHYACGLSHVELVEWLVNHGADLEARTEKGATVDACVGGANAARIRALLKAARAERDSSPGGPTVTAAEARKAGARLESAFAGTDRESADFDDSLLPELRTVYHYVRSARALPPGVSVTDQPGVYLERLLTSKLSEEQFVAWVLRELKQRRLYLQTEEQKDGFALALLPHMILTREAEGMNFDGATAVYRAACEGNSELVSWLVDHGATRKLRDAEGNEAELPEDIPNAEQIEEILYQND